MSFLKKTLLISAAGLTFWLALVAFYHTNKALPDKLDYHGEEYKLNDKEIEFLYDLTWFDDQGLKHRQQMIFDTIVRLIEGAENYILIDMFLFNSHRARDVTLYRDLSSELTEALVNRKKDVPGLKVDFITDPINTAYGGAVSGELERLQKAGVNVIITDLDRLRDSNFIYSAFWRTFVQWFGNTNEKGWLPHPFSQEEGEVTLRSYLRLLNFKANHRKVFVADGSGSMVTVVSSGNPHGGSSEHSNVALLVRGGLWRSIYETESAVAALSGRRLSTVAHEVGTPTFASETTVKVLSENQIKREILSTISASRGSESIKIAQFYLADRDIIKALIEAAAKGVEIQIILDPNRDAFGYEKIGIPNRQAAQELIRASGDRIKIRWYDTHGEQFHTKLFISIAGEQMTALLGSANLTRRNLDNFNLELDLLVRTATTAAVAQSITGYFDNIWNNEEGNFTLEFTAYQEDSLLKDFLYRVQEGLGLSTF